MVCAGDVIIDDMTFEAGQPSDIDDERAEQARHALRATDEVEAWADRFGLLSDVNRLRILLVLHRAPGITVGNLAEAVGMSHNATSHALAGLKMAGTVKVDRDGRYRRWSVIAPEIHELLHAIGASHSELHPHH